MEESLDRKPFSNGSLREAISLAIDTRKLLAPIGTGKLITGPYVTSSPYYNHTVQPTTPNLERSNMLLQELGYTLVDNYWAKDGKPLTITLSVHKSLLSAQSVAINLQSQFQKAGFRLELQFLEDIDWRNSIWRNSDFDILLSQWSFDRNEDIREQFHSNGTKNFTAYNSQTVDDLLDTAKATRSPQVKKETLREIHRILSEDRPMIFLWTLDSYTAVSNQVEGVTIHPFYYFTWINDWQWR